MLLISIESAHADGINPYPPPQETINPYPAPTFETIIEQPDRTPVVVNRNSQSQSQTVLPENDTNPKPVAIKLVGRKILEAVKETVNLIFGMNIYER